MLAGNILQRALVTDMKYLQMGAVLKGAMSHYLNWPVFSSFDTTSSKTPQEIYYG